ncbi:hypothetical protein B0H11DRAFT_2242209 [Mycena galericulata]|nr:hypothetical protein B0H11DRAFT_2242209 [Mycena galericulata]
MFCTYLLLVHSVEGISWKPGLRHRKNPNLCVAIYKDGIKVHRTPTKRVLAPKWEHLATISSDSESSTISLQLIHDSSLRGGNICLGVIDTDIATLLEQCSPDNDTKFAKLELKGIDHASKGKSAGILSVRLIRKAEAAATEAVKQAQSDIEKIKPGKIASAVVKTGMITESQSTAQSFLSALDKLTAKLEVLVRLGDEVAVVHPYVNMAWIVLTSVYKAAKKQQEADQKLIKLVETMVEVYTFVEDTEFLIQKIKSLEDKTLSIVKQTVECALFIQEYTANGFCRRALHTLVDPDKIDDLSTRLLQLKDAFEGRLAIQSLFLSTKMLKGINALEKSDTLKNLHPVDMNATSRSLCLPGTRSEILGEISTWLTVSSPGNILWLSGVAGSGKSTISTTIAESFRAIDRLGAFLFFDRNDKERSHPDAIIRTLAYSLAASNPHIGEAISAAIHCDPPIINAPIRTQFRSLLLDPLQSAEHSIQGPILIVLDALDECGDPDSRRGLLSLLSTELTKLPHLIRFFITSRREEDILVHFQSRFTEKTLDTGASSEDVGTFIRHEMNRIREHRQLDLAWPEQQHVQALINLAGGLFIWASTAVKFINGYRPKERLKTLINQNSRNLDSLYSIALHNSGPWADEVFARDARTVLAFIVLGRVPMTDGTIDMILGSSDQSSAEVLKYLGCVVQWSPGAQARTLHASFADYLTDVSRSGAEPWAIDAKMQSRALALGCLRILNTELRFNICGLEDSHLLNGQVSGLSNKVADNISSQLAYSSCYWINHIQDATFDQIVLNDVKTFFHEQFLYWLEALSLLGQISIASSALKAAAKYAKDDDDLMDLIADTIKFESAFAPLIAQSAIHIYVSALAFAPQASRGQLGTHWPSLQKEFNGHTGGVRSVCFSPDGGRIVSCSYDKTIRIWDAQTGQLALDPLEWRDWVTSVDFSFDGSQIVSGSFDNTVCIWDARTGMLVKGPLTGHTEAVNCVKFSPNRAHIASGSSDKTVCVWDAVTGKLVVGWIADTEKIISIAFSPNGARIASGSYDYTFRVWNTLTGELVVSLSQMSHGPRYPEFCGSIVFSPDGTWIGAGPWAGVCVWDANSGDLVRGPLGRPSQQIVTSFVDFSPDGSRIASTLDRTAIATSGKPSRANTPGFPRKS